MAFVTITEAARLVRRSRRTLYRDIDRGRLSKTVSPLGIATIDTAELLRVYGQLHGPGLDQTIERASRACAVEDFEELVETWEPSRKPSPEGKSVSEERMEERMRIRFLEERIKSLQHVLELEANLRKVKDEVTKELRTRLEEKDKVIKSLEERVLLLGYDAPEQKRPPGKRKGLLAKLFKFH